MTLATFQLSHSPLLLVVLFLVVFAAGFGLVAVLTGYQPGNAIPRDRVLPLIERERDLAAGLGMQPRTWFTLRIGVTAVGFVLGLLTGIPLMIVAGGFLGAVGVRWSFAGRAASRRLKMERAFLNRLRDLRDRMSVSNQSLDTALQEIGRSPGKECEYILAPWARGGSVVDNIVEAGVRSRSPVVEYACGVLLWSRSRSLDSLIAAIDEILLEVGAAQLAVEEETLVTLSQQRAVTLAMTVLMLIMFIAVVRIDLFRNYYTTFTGQLVLAFVLGVFGLLVGALGLIVRIQPWSRWNLRQLQREQEKLGG